MPKPIPLQTRGDYVFVSREPIQVRSYPAYHSFQKNAQLITPWTPPHTQKLVSIGSKGACLRMREIVTLRPLFFSLFLGSMRLATGRPVGPIIAFNGSNDALWWSLRPFNGIVNKKKIFFSIFTQKCEKLHYALWDL